ncbi:MAG TPA: glycosyltransferase family 87 protein [Polyangiaceae bacterium]|nr:glycosyltransferase family 87 protein [Polyangiaceae bacterium]
MSTWLRRGHNRRLLESPIRLYAFEVLAVLSLLTAVHFSDRLAKVERVALAAMGALFAAWRAVPLLRSMASNLREPREWDFLCFWLWGRLGNLRVDFYDPQKLAELAASFDVSREFSRGVTDVGFWYAPPTMLLFAPLGAIGLRTALFSWYLAQAAFACAAARLLWKEGFPAEDRLLGLAAVVVAVVTLPPVRSTVWFAQTNFMTLAFYLLLVRDRERPRAALWLVLGTLVKPYFALLLLYFAATKAYRVLGHVALLGLAAIGATALCFGAAPLRSFFATSPASRVPRFVYGEPINQSLLGTLLRRSGGALEGSILEQRAYVVIVVLLALALMTAIRRSGSARREGPLHVNLLFALLVYPGTLAHYSVMLLAPLFALFRRRNHLPNGAPAVLALFALVFAILGADRFESHNFWANLAVWVASMAACVHPAGASRALAAPSGARS